MKPSDRAIPDLLASLATLHPDDGIYLVYDRRDVATRWAVWVGHPREGNAGRWGMGPDVLTAIQQAFERSVEAVFDGRIDPHRKPKKGSG